VVNPGQQSLHPDAVRRSHGPLDGPARDGTGCECDGESGGEEWTGRGSLHGMEVGVAESWRSM
jgi:hypothetical protein